MRAWALLAALCLTAAAEEEPAECPAGTHRVSTSNPYEPFRCVKDGEEKGSALGGVKGPRGFSARPRCPRGTRPAATPDALQPYRCVRSASPDPEPELAPVVQGGPAHEGAADDPLEKGCPRGKRKTRTNDPLNPYQCVAQARRVSVVSEGSYARYSIPRELSFDYSRAFRLQDDWKEEVPAVYLALDGGEPGKPVTITVTRHDASQPSFQELESAIGRDLDWQKARDGGAIPVAGRKARLTYVPGDTRSVYLPVSKESYYSFVYSAPSELYETHLSAFERLLKSLRLERPRP